MPNAGDIVKNVRTVYHVDGLDTASRQAKTFAGRLDRISRASRGVTGRLSGMAKTVLNPLALAAGGAGAVGMVKHLVDVGAEAESTQLSLTGLIQSMSRASNLGLGGFEVATTAARNLRDEVRQLAVESPVTSKAIMDAFEPAAFKLSKAGMNLREQIGFARSIAIADMGNVVKGTAASDVRQILSGIANPKQIQTAVLQGVAKEAAELAKKGDLAGAAKIIRTAVTPDPKLLAAYGKSFVGLTATMEDKFKQLKEKAAKPVMEYLTGKLEEGVEWLSKNEDKAKALAERIGRGVVDGIETVVSMAKWLSDHWDAILTTVETLAVVWIGGKMLQGMSALVTLGTKLAGAMKAAAAWSQGLGGGKGLGVGGKLGLAGAAAAGLYGAASMTADAVLGAQKGGLRARMGSGGTKVFEGDRAAFLAYGEAMRSKAKASGAGTGGLLDGKVDPTDTSGLKGGGGRRKVKKIVAERLEVREKDFARLSTPVVTAIAAGARAQRPLSGLGLGAASVGL